MSTTEVILLALLFGVLAVAWSVIASLSRDRDDWMRSASSLARIVRGLDAWPVVETNAAQVTYGHARATIPIPLAVAVIGRHTALDRWSAEASNALAEYDALVDPEGR